MEDSMKPLARFAAMLTGLVLLLTTTASWGQTPVCDSPGCNPTASDANNNTAGGTGALQVVSGNLGNDNTAFGYAALLSNATGDRNTASGVNALRDNTSGYSNTASGINALANNTTGFTNTANGENALVSNTTGASNTASGANALFANFTGNYNTASGFVALASNTTGDDNTASGRLALSVNVTGFGNTAVGRSALLNSTGNKNIGIGYRAGSTLTSGHNNIYIGNLGAENESQTIRIGTAQTQTFIAGINAAGVSDATVMVDTVTGQLGIVTSSARYKQDIAPMGTRSEKVLDLQPVTFAYKDDPKGTTHYGLIAEQVAAVYPELVTHTATGEVQTVKYQELIPMLLNELRRQRQALHSQQQIFQRQQQELADLRALVGQRSGTASLSR
jgi:Chaperone of endosialidase